MYEKLDFLKIDSFLTAAECLNFTVAADRLFVSQSALSKSIASMEETLGYQLFIRGNRKVSLTKEGAYLYRELSRIMKDTKNVLLNSQLLKDASHGSFKLGTSGYMGSNTTFQRLCSQYTLGFPSDEIELFNLPFAKIRQHLQQDDVDMILTNNMNLNMFRGYCVLPISMSEPLFLCNPFIYDSALATFQTIRDFKDCRFVSINQGAHHTNYITAACQAYDFNPNIAKSVGNILEAIDYIGTTDYVTVLDRNMFPVVTSNLKIIPLEWREGMLRMNAVLLWKKDTQNPSLHRFTELAKSILGTEISFV